MKKMLPMLSLVWVVLFFLAPANLIAITYDESEGTQGDFIKHIDGNPHGTDGDAVNFSLDVGANEISGSTLYGASADSDGFKFTLSSNQQLESISLKLSNIVFDTSAGGINPVTGSLRFKLWTHDDSSYVTDIISFSEASTTASEDPFLSNAPLSEGLYAIYTSGFGGNGYPWAVDYKFRLTVSEINPVPEPSTWILLGTGLAGLAYYRRKKC